MDAKKETLSTNERDGKLRRAWSKLAALVDPWAWVWLDETGSNLGYTPTYAYAPRGERAHASTPHNQGENKTILAALTLDGIGPTLHFDGPMTTDRFEGCIQFRLAPPLKPGQIVVADNIRAHHSERPRAAIKARGAHFWHLPPYSCDFNPIEQAISKVKARTDNSLCAATWAALASITPTDCASWFSHCGYRPMGHEKRCIRERK